MASGIKIPANNVALGYQAPHLFTKALAPTSGMKDAKLPLATARKLDALKASNESKEIAPGSNIVVRAVRLGDLYSAGQQGVALQNLADAEWLHMPPHPQAVPLDVFVNASAGEVSLTDAAVVIARGFLLLPGGSVRIPKADYVTVRPNAFANGYRNTYALVTEIDGTSQLMPAPGLFPATDGRLFDKTQSFTVVASRDFIAPMAVDMPDSLSLPAMRTSTQACTRFGALTGTISLCAPTDVALLHVLRQYRHAALVVRHANYNGSGVVDYGGGVDVRGATLTGKAGVLPMWAANIVSSQSQVLHCMVAGNANGLGRQQFVLPVDDSALLAPSMGADSYNSEGWTWADSAVVAARGGNFSAVWLLSKTPIDFRAEASGEHPTTAAGDRVVLYQGPMKEAGKLLLQAGTNPSGIDVNVYANATTAELTDISAATVIPVRSETLAGVGALAMDIPGGGHVTIVARTVGISSFQYTLSGK